MIFCVQYYKQKDKETLRLLCPDKNAIERLRNELFIVCILHIYFCESQNNVDSSIQTQ